MTSWMIRRQRLEVFEFGGGTSAGQLSVQAFGGPSHRTSNCPVRALDPDKRHIVFVPPSALLRSIDLIIPSSKNAHAMELNRNVRWLYHSTRHVAFQR